MKFNCGLPSDVKRQQEFEQKKEKLLEEVEFYKSWHKWFAWYPVRVGERSCILFEYVERIYPHAYVKDDSWYYYKHPRDLKIRFINPKYATLGTNITDNAEETENES